ncbi:MAG: glycosyltransferase family A protein [Coprococcus sp.]
MEDKILTITIPSYNVEAYLEDCLESFVNSEVMDDIEVLIVNDGSSDRTEEIARRYESKYPNTYRLINQRKWWTWINNTKYWSSRSKRKVF